jgi:signal transduction histidine kinase
MIMNTYPIISVETVVFQNKQRLMSSDASLMGGILSRLDTLSPADVQTVMAGVDAKESYRVVISSETARVVYDTSVRENAVGHFWVHPEIAQALVGSDVFWSAYDGQAFESRYSQPIYSQGRIIGALYLFDYDSDLGNILSRLQTNLGTFSVIIFLALLLVSYLISMALTGRFSTLLTTIHAIQDGNYDVPAPASGKDELAQVAQQINRMSSRIQKTETLRAQFVTDASHELKTPLASMRLLADSILQTTDMDPETTHEFIADISEEIDRLGRLAEKLIHLTRMERYGASVQRAVFPQEIILRAQHMLQPLAVQANVQIECHADADCAILGEADDLYRIVYNLMENAVKYNQPGGQVDVYCYARDVEVLIIVKDTGVGIPEDDIPRIFDRFYRVDKARSRDAGGTGLGLAVVQETVERLGGAIQTESVLGQGTRFTLSFPVAIVPETPPE